MRIKVALPKGRLLEKTAALLERARWALDGYDKELRLYHIKSAAFHNVAVKVFHEKDIPIEVAVGNYDLGICGSDWVEELLAKYPSSAVVRVRDLGYGENSLYISACAGAPALAQMRTRTGGVRIASEYPNLAESFALKNRLARFSIFPVWGAAEAYPPENADLALIGERSQAELSDDGMTLLSKVLDSGACLIANRDSWVSKDLFEIVASIPAGTVKKTAVAPPNITPAPSTRPALAADGAIRLALADGHQQPPTLELLTRAGIKIEDYPSKSGSHRPRIGLDGVTAKVIRPQDMPLQVANGNFDLAITGHDWLTEHLYQFPSSPVRELADLKFGWVKVVAVVSQELDAPNLPGLRQLLCGRPMPLRVASEYTNIADKYARDNRLGSYRIIPTWGATESFLPDDADMLIENTQTGGTIARHNLKIIDTLFESTARLVGNAHTISSREKRDRVRRLCDALRAAVEG